MSLQFIKDQPRIQRVKPPDFIEKAAPKVRAFFEKNRRQSPQLFDGPLLFTKGISPEGLQVFQASYAYLLAQKKHPEIFDLPFYSLAITGLGKRDSSYLIGLRGEEMYQEPGNYEWAPSGGMDPSLMGGNNFEIEQCFYQELQEECALTAFHLLSAPKVEGLLIQEEEKLIDIVFSYSLDTKKVSLDLLEENKEYQKLYFLPEGEINLFIKNNLKKISPSMQSLYQALIFPSLRNKSEQVNWSVGKK